MKRHVLQFISVIKFGWSKLSIWGNQLWNPNTTKHWLILSWIFFHMVQYLVYYNFHVYKFGFYSHKNMIWLFEWKQSTRVLNFIGHYTSISRAIDGSSPRIIKQDGLISTNVGAYYMHCNYMRLMMQMTHQIMEGGFL